jgi:hypothetical protein
MHGNLLLSASFFSLSNPHILPKPKFFLPHTIDFIFPLYFCVRIVLVDRIMCCNGNLELKKNANECIKNIVKKFYLKKVFIE